MDDSPLARLPGELRNDIWRFALVEQDGHAVDITLGKASNPPGLLAACRSTRRETLEIYYAEDTFKLCVELGNELPRRQSLHAKLAARVVNLVVEPEIQGESNTARIRYAIHLPHLTEYEQGVLFWRTDAEELCAQLKHWGFRMHTVEVACLSERRMWVWQEVAWDTWRIYLERCIADERIAVLARWADVVEVEKIRLSR